MKLPPTAETSTVLHSHRLGHPTLLMICCDAFNGLLMLFSIRSRVSTRWLYIPKFTADIASVRVMSLRSAIPLTRLSKRLPFDNIEPAPYTAPVEKGISVSCQVQRYHSQMPILNRVLGKRLVHRLDDADIPIGEARSDPSGI